MKKYRIYSTYRMLHIVPTKEPIKTIEEMINVIDSIIYKEDAHYLVVEEDYGNNTDIPILSIWSIEDWEQFKNEYYEEQKEKVKVYGKTRNNPNM